MKTPSYTPTHGIVCLIDALGAKNFSHEETVNFLQSRRVIHKALEDKVADQVSSRSIQNPKIAVFNDTVIVAIECAPDETEEKATLMAMAVIVRKLISDGISKRIFFRGAIGVGKFFVDLELDTIIGEAVSDAAGWYESTEFIGCVLTPRAGYVLQKHLTTNEPSGKGVYLPYNVPTKFGTKEMFCVNWPRAFIMPSIRPAGCEKGKELKYLFKKFGECYFPQSADAKFENSVSFFRESIQRAQNADEK